MTNMYFICVKVRNIKMTINKQNRISHDALYNIHEIAYDLPDFVWTIQTYPDLIVVCGMKDIMDQMDRILQIESQSKQLFSYDTTFNFGDFFVSPLLFRHTIFKESPVIPGLCVIHERKLQKNHGSCLKWPLLKVSALTQRVFPIVTDEEKGIVNAIRKFLPKSIRVRCWNHILKNIHPEIHKSIGRWILEKEGVYCPFSGVLTNQSESFNMVLKSLQQWKEVPVECILLSFYLLQSFFMNEIKEVLLIKAIITFIHNFSL